jgi:uncharacterized protein
MDIIKNNLAGMTQVAAPRFGIITGIFSAASPEKIQKPFSKDLSMNPIAIIQKYYDPTSELYRILITHSVLVTAKAIALARLYSKNHRKAKIDVEFIEEAAMLHDIGIFRCHSPEILCVGSEPYIRHGIIGRKILEDEGHPRHALVCERHTGVGLTREDVIEQDLPLPERDFMPLSIEEKIICLADKFYSKNPERLFKEKSFRKIEKALKKRGSHIARRFEKLYEEITG